MRVRWVILVAAALMLPPLQAQVSKVQREAADWPMCNRDLAATRYSPLTQITTRNVSRLTRAWSYKIGKNRTTGITGGSELTPIVVAIVAAGASAIDDPEPAGSESLVVFALP